VGRNARLVFIAKSARTFCYGALGVLLPVYLSELGLDAGELGVAVTLTLLASGQWNPAVFPNRYLNFDPWTFVSF